MVVQRIDLPLELISLMLDLGKASVRRLICCWCFCMHRLPRHCLCRRVPDHHQETAPAITAGHEFTTTNTPAHRVYRDAEMISRLADWQFSHACACLCELHVHT